MTQSQAEQEASPDTNADPSIRAGLKLLTSPNVGKMFVAYLVSYTGTAMAPIALAFGVLELTGSAKDSAIVIAARHSLLCSCCCLAAWSPIGRLASE